MRGQKETRPCANCGEPLTRLLSQARGANWYCNARCQAGHAPSPITLARIANPLRGRQETRPCALCGAPVTRYLSQVTAGRPWTCSRTCGGQLRQARLLAAGRRYLPRKPRRGTTRPCAVCGAPVYANKSQDAKGQGVYCSRACHTSAMSKAPVLKTCAGCGAHLRLKPSQAGRVYCSRVCMTTARTMRWLDRMHNGRRARLDAKGYVLVWQPDHPNSSLKGWQLEHRLIAEAMVGRYLASTEHVHHRNGVKHDNRTENLEVMDGKEHAALSSNDYRDSIATQLAELAEYRRRFGPLPEEE